MYHSDTTDTRRHLQRYHKFLLNTGCTPLRHCDWKRSLLDTESSLSSLGLWQRHQDYTKHILLLQSCPQIVQEDRGCKYLTPLCSNRCRGHTSRTDPLFLWMPLPMLIPRDTDDRFAVWSYWRNSPHRKENTALVPHSQVSAQRNCPRRIWRCVVHLVSLSSSHFHIHTASRCLPKHRAMDTRTHSR